MKDIYEKLKSHNDIDVIYKVVLCERLNSLDFYKMLFSDMVNLPENREGNTVLGKSNEQILDAVIQAEEMMLQYRYAEQNIDNKIDIAYLTKQCAKVLFEDDYSDSVLIKEIESAYCFLNKKKSIDGENEAEEIVPEYADLIQDMKTVLARYRCQMILKGWMKRRELSKVMSSIDGGVYKAADSGKKGSTTKTTDEPLNIFRPIDFPIDLKRRRQAIFKGKVNFSEILNRVILFYNEKHREDIESGKLKAINDEAIAREIGIEPSNFNKMKNAHTTKKAARKINEYNLCNVCVATEVTAMQAWDAFEDCEDVYPLDVCFIMGPALLICLCEWEDTGEYSVPAYIEFALSVWALYHQELPAEVKRNPIWIDCWKEATEWVDNLLQSVEFKDSGAKTKKEFANKYQEQMNEESNVLDVFGKTKKRGE